MGNKQSNTQSSAAQTASSSATSSAVPPHALPRRNTISTTTAQSSSSAPVAASSSTTSYAEAASRGNLRRINQSATTAISQPPSIQQQPQQTHPQLPPPPTTSTQHPTRHPVASRTQPQRPQAPHRHGSSAESAEANPYIMIMQMLQEALGGSSTTNPTNPNTRVIYRTGHPTAATPLLLGRPGPQQLPRNRAQFDPWLVLLENLVEEADMRNGGASLQQLMQRMEPVNRGISQEEIEAESMKFTLKDIQKELPKDQLECPICLSEFSSGETLRRLPCLHVYHAECVDKWIQANATCPTCRIDLKELLRQQQEFGFAE